MSDNHKELSKLLSANQSLVYIPETGKVKCSLSGHEMPHRLDAVQGYIQGKKYRKLLSEKTYDYQKYKLHLVPSQKRSREHQLFCLLTLRHLNKSPHHIDCHINGKRFRKAFTKWEDCQRRGVKFQPNKGQKRKKEFVDWEEGMDMDKEGSDDTDDSMSDLYPVADFASDQKIEQSDYDMAEKAPVEAASDDKQMGTKGIKRKSTLPAKTAERKSKLKKKKMKV